MAKSSLVYGLSLAAHVGLALGVASIERPNQRETIAISVSEAKKAEKEPAKEAPPPPVIEARADAPRAQTKAKAASAAPKVDAAPPPQSPQAAAPAGFEGLPDFGIALGNGGPGGIAVPQGNAGAAPAATASAAPRAPKVLAPKPAEDACSDPVVKPKPRSIAQPAYTASAREAGVEGRVRVEVSVDATGRVTGVRLLAGLGHGLDEAALDAARRASFEPASRCGKAVSATFVIAMRFAL